MFKVVLDSGVEVSAEEYRERVGIRAIEEGEEVITAPAPQQNGFGGGGSPFGNFFPDMNGQPNGAPPQDAPPVESPQVAALSAQVQSVADAVRAIAKQVDEKPAPIAPPAPPPVEVAALAVPEEKPKRTRVVQEIQRGEDGQVDRVVERHDDTRRTVTKTVERDADRKALRIVEETTDA